MTGLPTRLLPVLAAVALTPGLAQAHAQGGPLPNLDALQARAVASYDKTAALREKYTCRVNSVEKDLDGKGRLKKTENLEQEVFFVNRHEIRQTLRKNGQPLSADEQRKQEKEVRKAIEDAEKNKPKNTPTFSIRDILKLGKLTNERRIEVAGRPTIVFDLSPDPTKGGNVEERFVRSLEGTVSIDEATGTVQDVNAEGKRDFKVGGGLLADVHKGFRGHLVLAPLPDGVWMFKLIEGKGEARIGLFLNRGGEFRAETEGCKISDVTATQSGDKVHEAPAKK